MIAVMSVIVTGLMLGGSALIGAFQVEQAANATYTRLTSRSALIDEFRADVSRATAAPESAEELKAGPACLILRVDESAYVYYRLEDGNLERGTLPATVQPQTRPLGPLGTTVEFSRDGSGGRLITMRVLEPTDSLGKTRRAMDISAALGGDLR